MNKLKKISVVVLMSLVIAAMFSTIAFADNFNLEAFDNGTSTAVTNVNKMVDTSAATIISAARVICVAIAMVMLLVIAMKYMISAPGDRADIKKHSINYVIGAFILFGISGILTIINSFAKAIKA